MKILILTLVILILLWASYYMYQACIQRQIEYYENYLENSYGTWKTGDDPLFFYSRPYYRKPYDYPFLHYQSYPDAYMAPAGSG